MEPRPEGPLNSTDQQFFALGDGRFIPPDIKFYSGHFPPQRDELDPWRAATAQKIAEFVRRAPTSLQDRLYYTPFCKKEGLMVEMIIQSPTGEIKISKPKVPFEEQVTTELIGSLEWQNFMETYTPPQEALLDTLKWLFTGLPRRDALHLTSDIQAFDESMKISSYKIALWLIPDITDAEVKDLFGQSTSLTEIKDRINRQAETQEQLVAGEIYSVLQRERGITSLHGFYNGEVIRQGLKKRVKIEQTGPIGLSNPAWRTLRQAGFSDEDLQRGIIITDFEFRNPNWPEAHFNPEPQLNLIEINSAGKVFEWVDSSQTYQPASIEPHHIDALERVARLSKIPQQILETFGSYDEFLKSLGQRNMAGIDFVEMAPSQILYNGGLRAFVEALQLEKDGKQGKLDSSLWQILHSLDGQDHFDHLIEALRRAHSE
ncbi:MAG: hypothetical protein Q7S60_02370 [bacterium]|nr:hypothetical protein [bacterium]